MANKVILCISVLISLFNAFVISVSNIRFRDRMRQGGRRMLVLADLSAAACYVQLVVNIVFAVRAFLDMPLGSGGALLALVGSVSICILLRARKRQNDGMSLMLNTAKDTRLSRNAMMANISHEIRTPLNTIMGMTEVLASRKDIPPEVVEKLSEMASAGGDLLSVINNLIDFSKIESGKLDVIENEYSVKELMQNIIRQAQVMVKDSEVEFLADIDTKLPSTLYGDDIRIGRAVLNILSNACKYTHVGVVTFRASGIRNDDGQFVLCLDVEDTGVGIGQKERDNLFRSYNSTRENIGTGGKGAGLGLLITKSFVDLMGGTLDYVSEEGEGTTFTIEIPQMVIDDTPIETITTEKFAPSNSNYMFTAPMAKVLVVDDNIVNLFVAKELLEKYEIEVQTAQSGAECLELLDENYYDIIFMDYVMPNMDGHETLKRIRLRQNDYLKKIPVVALTAQMINGSEKIYMDEGFQGYLSKPIVIPELEGLLISLLPEEYICSKGDVEFKTDDSKLEDKPWYKRFASIMKDYDLKKGLEYCSNDYTSYLSFLRVVYSDGFSQSRKLMSYVETGNLEAFRIAIHAIKSVTASAGADKLSELALELETAAKNNDLKYITGNISEFLKGFDAFLQCIDVLLQRESEMMSHGYAVQKIDADESEISRIAGELLSAIDDYNIDDCEDCVARLERINLGREKEKNLQVVKDVLQVFKYDEAAAYVKKTFNI